MVDRALRPVKARLLGPAARALEAWPADGVTAVGAAVGVAAALLAATGHFELALLAWWTNRLFDGLDGELARVQRGDAAARPAAQAAPARGAYLDLMADLVVYAALPLGLAAGVAGTWSGVTLVEPTLAWASAAAALAAFYLNLGSWSLLSAALERIGAQADDGPDAPGLRMPAGLIEGTETIVAFSIALAWPSAAPLTLAIFAAMTLLGAVQRSLWGARRLGRG